MDFERLLAGLKDRTLAGRVEIHEHRAHARPRELDSIPSSGGVFFAVLYASPRTPGREPPLESEVTITREQAAALIAAGARVAG